MRGATIVLGAFTLLVGALIAFSGAVTFTDALLVDLGKNGIIDSISVFTSKPKGVITLIAGMVLISLNLRITIHAMNPDHTATNLMAMLIGAFVAIVGVVVVIIGEFLVLISPNAVFASLKFEYFVTDEFLSFFFLVAGVVINWAGVALIRNIDTIDKKNKAAAHRVPPVAAAAAGGGTAAAAGDTATSTGDTVAAGGDATASDGDTAVADDGAVAAGGDVTVADGDATVADGDTAADSGAIDTAAAADGAESNPKP